MRDKDPAYHQPTDTSAASPADATETVPNIVHLEYEPGKLTRVTTEDTARIRETIGRMVEQGASDRDVQFAIYSSLEEMGVDLSGLHDNAVAIEMVYSDGTSEPRAMSTSSETFGDMIRRAELHPNIVQESEYPANQGELLENLKQDVADVVKGVKEGINWDETKVPSDMLAYYKDQAQNLLHQIYQGPIDDQTLNNFLHMTHDMALKYAEEGRARHSRQGALRQSTSTESLLRTVNKSLDEQHVSEGRHRLGRLDEQFGELSRVAQGSVQSAGEVHQRLLGIRSAIGEMLSNRYGRDQHIGSLRAMLQDLDARFINDDQTKKKVKDVLDSIG